MEADPTGNWDPFMASVALATPADPTRFTEPSGAPLDWNCTAPTGVTLFGPLTVAVRKTTSEVLKDVTLLSSVMLLEGVEDVGAWLLHLVTRLKASTDPN